MTHGRGHRHDHGAAVVDHRGRLAAVLAITGGVLVAEVVGALLTGSLALLADAAHMLTDVAGLALAYVAAGLVRRPVTERRTWGLRRAEVLAAAAQAAVLLAVGVYLAVEAVQRLLDPVEVTSGLMGVFGLVGLGYFAVCFPLIVLARRLERRMNAAHAEVRL